MNAQTLTFRSRSWWKSEWDLLNESGVIGSFVITKPMSYARAEATGAGKTWQIDYAMWSWTSKLLVRDTAGGVLAETERVGSWWKYHHTIALEGKKYILKNDGWGMRYTVTDEYDQEVLVLKSNWWGKTEVDMKNSAVPDAIALLLAFIAFYLAKISEMQSSSAGAVVVTS